MNSNSAKTIHFGILGPGKIAHRFASAFEHTGGAKVYAVASRDVAKAKEFAATYKAEKFYGDYDSLVNDADVDVVYIATPHPFHYEQALLCIRHGKPVICEKPLALNLRQATGMIDAARTRKVFLMEAMWSRFFPATKKVIELVEAGTIGEIQFLQADFGFATLLNPEHRTYSLALGGGAQLDVGVYPLFLALALLGRPQAIKAAGAVASTGADYNTSALLQFANGALAHIFSSFVADSPKQGDVVGTTGRLIIHAPWHKSQHVTLRMNTGEVTEFPFPYPGNGFQFQIEEVVKCLREGKTESTLMPHALSLLMAEVSDEIRRQIGVKYAAD